MGIKSYTTKEGINNIAIWSKTHSIALYGRKITTLNYIQQLDGFILQCV